MIKLFAPLIIMGEMPISRLSTETETKITIKIKAICNKFQRLYVKAGDWPEGCSDQMASSNGELKLSTNKIRIEINSREDPIVLYEEVNGGENEEVNGGENEEVNGGEKKDVKITTVGKLFDTIYGWKEKGSMLSEITISFDTQEKEKAFIEAMKACFKKKRFKYFNQVKEELTSTKSAECRAAIGKLKTTLLKQNEETEAEKKEEKSPRHHRGLKGSGEKLRGVDNGGFENVENVENGGSAIGKLKTTLLQQNEETEAEKKEEKSPWRHLLKGFGEKLREDTAFKEKQSSFLNKS